MTSMPPLSSCTLRRLRHLAVIMDGNGRWAKQRHLPRMLGHQEGLKVVRKIVKKCGELGIEVLTVFAFSSENWQRPAQEVEHLMTLFLNTLKIETEKLNQNNVQLRIVGSLERFTEPLRQWIEESQKLTVQNTGLKLIIAVDYSGQWDIIQAVKAITRQIKAGILQSDLITQDLFSTYLSLSDLPPPDLLIRTGGEYRISNFFLWQLAYTELYFTETLWPDFNEEILSKALLFYSQRERRFGYTSEQLAEINAEA